MLIAFGLVVPTLVLAHNGNHKASEAVGGVNSRRPRPRAGNCSPTPALLPLAGGGALLRPHGPNLDVRVGDDISTNAGRRALVLNAILEGRARGNGQMPALLYQGKEAEDVAAFVAAVAGH